MRKDLRRRLTAIWGASLAFGLGAAAFAVEVDATRLSCPDAAPVKSGDGKVRLAMIVGVSEFKFVTGLPGAVKDAGRMYSFLTDSPANVFPKENVCVLTNGDATYQEFKDKFQKVLVDRAAGAEEIVVYYAGHGSMLADKNRDETDGFDETLFLHDSSKQQLLSEGLKYNQLRDDEFNVMLAALSAKAKSVTVILDSCNSGSVTRGFGEERARFVRPDSGPASAPRATEDRASFSEFEPDVLKNVVVLAAARDSEDAIETPRGGRFTRALLEVLKRPDVSRISYDQLLGIVAAKMATTSIKQNPILSGDGRRFIFSSDIPYQPRFDWEVASSSPTKTIIRGERTTIGMGHGAEFLILPNAMTVDDAKRPDIAKARMKATKMLSFNEWELRPIESFRSEAIEPKDYAQLVRHSSKARRLRLRLRPANETGGIVDPGAFVEMMRTPLNDEFRVENALGVIGADGEDGLVTFEAPSYDFEISRNRNGALEISDGAGLVRNTLPRPVGDGAEERRALAKALSNHHQQLTLLADWRPTGGSLTPNRSLEVSLVPYLEGGRVPAKGCEDHVVARTDWPKAANAPQRVPLCAYFRIKVKLKEGSPISLRIAASVLSADGRMFAYPRKFDSNNPQDTSVVDQGGIELNAGEEEVLHGVLQADFGSIGKPEYVYVLGLPATAQGEGSAAVAAYTIPWHLLSTPQKRTRAAMTRAEEVNKREYGTYTILRLVTVDERP